MSHTDVLTSDWLAAPVRRSRFRMVLLVLLVVLLVFLGGIEVQKRWGSGTSATSPAAIGRPTAGSFPAGGFGGTRTGAPTSQTGTTTATATPAVIGSLTRIKGHTWIVKDLGGTSHTVEVTGRTTVTRSLAHATGPLRSGSSVTVQGVTHGTTVTATAVTIR